MSKPHRGGHFVYQYNTIINLKFCRDFTDFPGVVYVKINAYVNSSKIMNTNCEPTIISNDNLEIDFSNAPNWKPIKYSVCPTGKEEPISGRLKLELLNQNITKYI